jgi:hypothetical protein
MTDVLENVEPIWRDVIPAGNYWIESGRNYLNTLTKDDIIFHISRIDRARRDYAKAANPKNTEYFTLVNVPRVNEVDYSDISRRGINNTLSSIDFLWNKSKGIVPFPW